MNEQEIKELVALLEKTGVRAELCDTKIGLSGLTAVCGSPTEVGEGFIEDYIMVPKALVGSHPEMFITVEGDSMKDAGYEPGDRLRVRFGIQAYDGEDVVAYIDGKCTVKTLFTDEEGTRWLVPRNEEYDAIEITDDMDARILGVVMGVEKRAHAASSRSIQQAIRRTKNKYRTVKKLKPEEIAECIRKIGEEITYGRQWYSVYRTLQDARLFSDDTIGDFCKRVATLLPEHEHLPDVKEVQRMAVDSFADPVSLWTESKAPVSGKRFEDYLQIARRMSYLLENSHQKS